MNLFFKGIKDGLYYFSDLVSNLINTVLLVFAYIFIIGLTAIIAKIFQKKFLQTNKMKWFKISNNKKKEDFYRQF